MMLDIILLVAVASVSGHSTPSDPPPEAYIHLADQEQARRHDPNNIPCSIKKHEYGMNEIVFVPTDQCYKMLPPQRIRGIWIDDFEGSRFYPGLIAPPKDEAGPVIWLDTERVKLSHGLADGGRNGRVVLIDFVGRRTRYAGAYGHLGMSNHEIIVDRIISARELR